MIAEYIIRIVILFLTLPAVYKALSHLTNTYKRTKGKGQLEENAILLIILYAFIITIVPGVITQILK